MANELSDRQIEELKSAFGLFDYESGTVEVRELPNLLKTIGLAPNLEELKTLEQVLKTIRDRCYDFGTIFAIKIGTRNAGLPMYVSYCWISEQLPIPCRKLVQFFIKNSDHNIDPQNTEGATIRSQCYNHEQAV
jgi:hypothetical protein